MPSKSKLNTHLQPLSPNMNTRTQYVLIDFENVQPTDINLLKSGTFEIKIFLGANQNKLPLSLVSTLQCLGERVEYIALETGGKNALDFHIAYYIGL